MLLCSGFKDLVPHFTVCHAGEDEQYLPTVSKCHNLLMACLHLFPLCQFSVDSLILWQLPRYQNERVLRNKLLQAIHFDTGDPQSFITEPRQNII